MAKKGGEGNTGGGCTRVPKKRWQKRGDKKEAGTLSENGRTGRLSIFSHFMGRLARVDTFGKCAHWVLLDIFGFYGALRALERFGKMRALGACRNFRVYGALCALGHFWKMRALGACR